MTMPPAHSTNPGFRRRALLLALLLPILLTLLSPLGAAAEEQSAAEQLAQRYAPISFLKEQEEACDSNGEPFLPAPVDVTFGGGGVVLRDRVDAPGEPVSNPALYEAGANQFVDLPGHPREPGCVYERTFKERMDGARPVVYAHIATEADKRGVALQYWFFYWYNDFNNVHEGDWEMIQLLFDADTTEEALQQEPIAAAYAQHEGGEVADWTDPKLEKIDNRPVTYPSRGSHASYYGSGLWIGWGRDGSGLGCDDSTGPAIRVDPEVRLLDDTNVNPNSSDAWIAFPGRWGERGAWFFDGPTGPNMKPQWTAPISWQEGLRPSSIRLLSSPVMGPAATGVFCEVVGQASTLLILSKPYPWLVGLAIVAGAAIVALLLWKAWPTVRLTWPLYRRHFPLYARIGAVLIPLTLLASGFAYLLNESAWFVARFPVNEDNLAVDLVLSGAVLAQQALLLLLVGPAVIWATGEVLAGRRPGALEAYRAVWRSAPQVALGEGVIFVALLLLSITVLAIPIAVVRGVRWAFAPQAVVLGGARGMGILRTSAASTHGRWWRIALTAPVLAFVAAAPAPIFGILLMIGLRVPIDLANGAGAIVYAVTQPLAIVGGTLLYLNWTARAASAEPAAEPAASPVPSIGDLAPAAPPA
ncbi:MAG: hypothetical protein IT337_17115 [Thermomicrobiales bacterium]|nr:hypothetical protein [Thermomicrobiales bacterium]